MTSSLTIAQVAIRDGGAWAIDWRLPSWALIHVAGVPLWRWLAVLVALAAAITLGLGLLRLAQYVCSRTASPTMCANLALLLEPLRLIVVATLFLTIIGWAPISPAGRFYLVRGARLVLGLGAVWTLSRILDLVVARVHKTTKPSSFSLSALPLVARILKIVAAVLVAAATLGSWGFDMTAVLAGVGLGGIAVALAAQRTLENLFGGISIVSDAPVTVGDFCRFGDRMGVVEDIGLRSTRIRTLDRTIVTIPNGQFSAMALENFARRDKVWFHPTLTFDRDTSPELLRRVVDGVAALLRAHPRVEVGPLPVRLVGVRGTVFDVEVFAYVTTTDFDEYLDIQQQLLLRILEIVAHAGAALAPVSQTSLHVVPELRRQMPESG